MAVRVEELLKIVSDDILQKIGADLGVDYAYQKLTGLKMFKVLLYSLAETTRISLRTMECAYKKLFGEEESTRHSSLSNRLSRINPDYFKEIFEHLVLAYGDKFSLESKYKNIHRFDSTLMGLSTKLIQKIGLNCGADENTRYFKITVGQKGLIPASVRFCTEQPEASEETALKKAILETVIHPNDIVLFDRGLTGAPTLIGFDEQNIQFVTRAKVGRRHKVLEDFEIESSENEIMRIISDQKVLLQREKPYFFKTPFRLIKAESIKTNEELWFLTNIFTMNACEITELYKRRWDIEVFFRFIKQELNMSHFLARNLNGMMVYTYMILIFAILLLIYKAQNQLTGYKFVKLAFFRELEIALTADVVQAYGGDKEKYLKDWGLA